MNVSVNSRMKTNNLEDMNEKKIILTQVTELKI
jgi:hypothetical protein